MVTVPAPKPLDPGRPDAELPGAQGWGPELPAAAAGPPARCGVPHLLDLTDEEIVAVDGATQGVVSLPYLNRIPDDDREAVRSTALRGLFARGLLRFSAMGCDSAGREPGPGERTVDVGETLAWILTVRRTPVAVLAAQRIAGTPDGPRVTLRYLHDTGDRVLVEDVSSSGMHGFAVADRQTLPQLMQDFLVATDPDPAQGSRLDEAAWPAEVVPSRDGAAVLGGVHLVAEIVVRRDDAPVATSHTAYVYPHVAYVGAAPLDDPAAARLTRLPPDRLGDWAARLLDGVARPPGAGSRPPDAFARPPEAVAFRGARTGYGGGARESRP